MVLNILAVNLCVTFLRIQHVNYDLLVLRPSIDLSRVRTSDPLICGIRENVLIILRTVITHGCDGSYQIIHGTLGASVYHQLEEGLVSALIHPVGPQLVIRIVLNTVWLHFVVTTIVVPPRLICPLVLLEVLLYRIIRFREGGLKYLCIPQLHIL